jgi:hypothetical protein
MKMPNPRPTFAYLATALRDKHPNMAYLYVTQSRVDTDLPHTDDEANGFLREIWNGGEGGEKRIFISVGGHTRDTALSTAELGGLVAFGRLYVPNVSSFLFVFFVLRSCSLLVGQSQGSTQRGDACAEWVQTRADVPR